MAYFYSFVIYCIKSEKSQAQNSKDGLYLNHYFERAHVGALGLCVEDYMSDSHYLSSLSWRTDW